MKRFVRIQSTTTIHVTPGLQYKEVTNPDAHVPDRLKVMPMWPSHAICIRSGVGIYPSEITEWAAVKALVDCGVLTIGEFVDEGGSEEEKKIATTVPETEEGASTLDKKIKKVKKTLEDITE